MADAEKPYHTRVRLISEELDESGEVVDTLSEDVLAEFDDDSDDDSVGRKTDAFVTSVTRKNGRV